MRQGITTMYNGIEYRSRLEAKWAAFFTNIGWEYTYEPFDGKGYIPDFLIHGDYPMLVEVKPGVVGDDYRRETAKIDSGLVDVWTGRVLIVGASPSAPGLADRTGALISLGLMRDHGSMNDPDLEGDWDWCHTQAWHSEHSSDNKCRLHVSHNYQSFYCTPCNCYDGSGYDEDPQGTVNLIDDAWSRATNSVKWRGRDAA